MPVRLFVPPLLALALVCSACSWFNEERSALRSRLEAFKNEVNSVPADGVGALTHAAALGRYFTDDVIVELGDGSAPITGREMLMGMIARLQSRTAMFKLEFADITVRLAPDEQSAGVHLTAELIRREPSSRQSLDAREFELAMRREANEWKIARVVAVQTLK